MSRVHPFMEKILGNYLSLVNSNYNKYRATMKRSILPNHTKETSHTGNCCKATHSLSVLVWWITLAHRRARLSLLPFLCPLGWQERVSGCLLLEVSMGSKVYEHFQFWEHEAENVSLSHVFSLYLCFPPSVSQILQMHQKRKINVN